jgi:predicted ABC-type exoprotein transport system permease subunit
MDAAALPPTSSATPPDDFELPAWGRKLVWAALFPFVMSGALSLIVRAEALPFVTLALASYAGVVVSLLGGVHWGLAMRRADREAGRYAWGVIATLCAWVGVVMPAYAGLVVLGVLLVATYLVDRKVYPREGLAPWLTLRFRFTALAALSCFIAAANA